MSHFNLEICISCFWNFSWITFHNFFASFFSIFFYLNFYYSNCVSSFNLLVKKKKKTASLLFFHLFLTPPHPQLSGRFSQSYLPTLSFPFPLSDFSIILVSWSLSPHIPLVYMGDTQGHWVTNSLKWPTAPPSIPSSAKDGRETVWGCYCEPGKQGLRLLCRF